MSWINKYKPKTIAELKCSESHLSDLRTWLDLFYFKKQKIKNMDKNEIQKIKFSTSIVIRGQSGSGKSILVDLLLKDMKINKMKINFSSLKKEKKLKDKNFGDLLSCILYNDGPNFSIDNNNNNNSSKKSKISKFAIVVDNVENLSIKGKTKTLIDNLIKHVKNTFFCPLIFIVGNSHVKFIKEFEKKKNKFIDMDVPSYSVLSSILEEILEKENLLCFDDFESFRDLIIEASQHDIRKLINILENFILVEKFRHEKKNNNNPFIITQKTAENLLIYERKDTKKNIYDTTLDAFKNFKSPDNTLDQYSRNTNSMPLMIQRNYVPYISQSDSENKLEESNKIANSISNSDIIEHDIRTFQNWASYKTHGIYSCVIPSYYLSRISYNGLTFSPLYILDFNMVSKRKINGKNLLAINKEQKGDVFEYMYMTKLIKYMLLDNGNLILKKLKNQDFDIDALKNLVKIDKISLIQNYNEFCKEEEKVMHSYFPDKKRRKKKDGK